MRILQVCHRFFPSIGGTEEMVGRLARGLARAGHSLTVLTSREPGAPPEEELEGVRVVRLPIRRVGPLRLPVGYLRALRTLSRDVLHIHGQRVWPSDALLPFVGTIPGPKIFTPHGFFQWQMRPSFRERMYYRAWFARRIRRFHRVIALTQDERRTLQSWGLRGDRIALTPQGVDPAEFVRAPGSPTGKGAMVLYVGGFYPNKRVDLLLHSLAEAGTQAKLVVAGPPGPRPGALEECRGLAKRLGVEANFVGVVPRARLIELYHEADVFALPSLFEGFGLVLLEAMAAGLPFVSTPVGAALELASTGAGAVVQDIQSMGPLLATLLADQAKRSAMAAAGVRAVKDYTWERVVVSHASLYQELMDQGHHKT